MVVSTMTVLLGLRFAYFNFVIHYYYSADCLGRWCYRSLVLQVSRKFLLRHNIKSVFQWGLEKTANNFIAEVKCVSPPKVFHERLQSYVFLKTIDIVDVPID